MWPKVRFSNFHLMAQSAFWNDVSQALLFVTVSYIVEVKQACISRSTIRMVPTAEKEAIISATSQLQLLTSKTKNFSSNQKMLVSSLLYSRELWTSDSHLLIDREESHPSGASNQKETSHHKEILGYFPTEIWTSFLKCL